MEIVTRNANTLFSEMFWQLKSSGVRVNTRNGPAMRFPEPVLTTVKYPQERVLFHPGRDANPIFHVLESLWILAGRRDVAFLRQFNSKIGQYSDDGKVFNAAYGYRLRSHFGRDQLEEAIKLLRKDPETRQAVLQLWDPADLNKRTLDKACNLELVFEIHAGRLNMTVLNRSNDMWYGYAGANVVHFTMLQEFVACAVGVNLGVYRTFSTNLHLYLEMYDAQKYISNIPDSFAFDHYSSGRVRPAPLMLNGDFKTFLKDCEAFCNDPFNENGKYTHPYFMAVAHPLAMISRVRKAKAGDGRGYASRVKADDWKNAAFMWIAKRELLQSA